MKTHVLTYTVIICIYITIDSTAYEYTPRYHVRQIQCRSFAMYLYVGYCPVVDRVHSPTRVCYVFIQHDTFYTAYQ